MSFLPSGNIFRELQVVHDTGYFSAQPSLEDRWQQVSVCVCVCETWDGLCVCVCLCYSACVCVCVLGWTLCVCAWTFTG